MKYYLFMSLLLSAGTLSFGQMKNNDNKDGYFAFIENSTDTTLLKFIKTFQCISKRGDDISSFYRAIKIQAKNLGANCFKVKNFTRDSTTKTMTLTLDTYYGDDSIFNINSNSHEKNRVYIFSDDKFSNKTYSFRINNIKRTIKSGTYYKYTIKEGEEVKINKGGVFGATVWIKWEKDNISRFFTMSGFGINDVLTPYPYAPYPYGGMGAGVSFHSGRMKYMDTTLGRLLSVILKSQQ